MTQGVATAPLPRPAKRGRSVDVPRSGWMKARERLAWFLVAPSILVVALVALYPLFQSFRLSFTNARFGSTRPEVYVGFDNYVRLFNDNVFRQRNRAHDHLHRSLGCHRDRAWHRHCAHHQLELQRSRRGPDVDADSLGDSDSRLQPALAIHVQPGQRSHQRYPGQPAGYPRYSGGLDRQSHNFFAGNHRGRRLEDHTVHGVASAGRVCRSFPATSTRPPPSTEPTSGSSSGRSPCRCSNQRCWWP